MKLMCRVLKVCQRTGFVGLFATAQGVVVDFSAAKQAVLDPSGARINS